MEFYSTVQDLSDEEVEALFKDRPDYGQLLLATAVLRLFRQKGLMRVPTWMLNDALGRHDGTELPLPLDMYEARQQAPMLHYRAMMYSEVFEALTREDAPELVTLQ